MSKQTAQHQEGEKTKPIKSSSEIYATKRSAERGSKLDQKENTFLKFGKICSFIDIFFNWCPQQRLGLDWIARYYGNG